MLFILMMLEVFENTAIFHEFFCCNCYNAWQFNRIIFAVFKKFLLQWTLDIQTASKSKISLNNIIVTSKLKMFKNKYSVNTSLKYYCECESCFNLLWKLSAHCYYLSFIQQMFTECLVYYMIIVNIRKQNRQLQNLLELIF
jgi:hypothetical protein